MKVFFKKLSTKFSFHYIAYTILFGAVIFSYINLVSATTPNPGHPWSELGDGVFVFTNSQTVTPYTYTFPAANSTVLTTNALVSVAQGGTGAGTLTGLIKGNGTSAMTVATAGTDYLTPTGSAASLTSFPTFNQDTTGKAGNIAGGLGGQILYQSAVDTTNKLANGSLGQVLTSQGTTVAPQWTTLTGSPISVVNTSNLFSTGLTGTGNGVTTSTYSNFFGTNAGNGATGASNSNFLGQGAGSAATSATYSNFLGYYAGQTATGASYSNFFGRGSGASATTASNSNFFGYYAGNSSTSAAYSNFFGYQAGYNSPTASNAIFIGQNAGVSDTVNNIGSADNWSILLGYNTNTGGFSNSILLGGANSGTPISNTKSNQFMLADSVTDMRLRGIEYNLPAAQGGSNTTLINNGSGSLTWGTDPNLSGYIPYTGATTNVDLGLHNLTVDTNSLFVDSVNHKLGVGTTTPGARFEVKDTSNVVSNFIQDGGTGSSIITLSRINHASQNNVWNEYISNTAGVNGSLQIYPTGSIANIGFSGNTSNAQQLVIQGSTGNIGINTTSPVSQLTQKSYATTESASLGTEITNATNWTTTAGWSGDYNAGFAHTAGTTTLSRTMTITSGQIYQISFTVTGRTLGSFTIGLGGETSNTTFYATGTYAPKTLNGSGNLIFTPTTDFNGTISAISVKAITGTYNPSYSLLDNTGTAMLEIRSSLSSNNNQFIGKGSGRYNTTGVNNTVYGSQAFQNNTSGYSNTAFGTNVLLYNTTGFANAGNGTYSLSANTTGYSNTANGYASLYNNTTGANNTATGYSSLFSNTIGINNVANGYNSLYNNTTGGNNTAVGLNSGRYLADGATALTNPGSSLFLGYNTRANADGNTNENVIGNSAIGNGSNTMTFGSTAITNNYFTGNILSSGTAGRTFGMSRNATTVGQGLTLSSGGAFATGTDLSGGDLTLKSGISTGTGSSAMHFFTSTAQGSTNTTDNTPTEKMTILGNGNVGIGTTNPSGALSLYNSSSDLGMSLQSSTNTRFWLNTLSNTLLVGSSGSTLPTTGGLAITNTGNVGIGTTSPTNILSLGGNTSRTIWMERNTTTVGQGLTLSSGGAFATGTDLSGGDLTLKSGISTGTGSSAMHFFTTTAGTTGTTDNTPTEKMTLTSTGNLGLGILNAAAKIDAVGGGMGIIIGGDSASNTRTDATLKYGRMGSAHYLTAQSPMAIFLTQSDSANNILNFGGGTGSMNAATQINFYTAANNTTTTGTFRMKIDSTGNIGMGGVTSPTALLHINAGSATAGTAPLKFTSGTNLGTTEAGAMEFDGTHLYFTVANAGTRYQLDQQSGGSGIPYTGAISDVDLGTHNLTVDTNLLFVDSVNNKVGIGTITPSYKLDVKGTSATDVISSDIGFNINPVPNASSGSVALITAAGNVDAGPHTYRVTYLTAIGETATPSAGIGAVTTDASHGQVTVTVPVSSDSRVTGRKIYRSKAAGNYWEDFLVATINDNTTTSYVDNIADASLTGVNGTAYNRMNTTSKQITIGGSPAMTLDKNGTFFGLNAGSSITTGGFNSLFGYRSGLNVTSGVQNTFLGNDSGLILTTGSSNVAVGMSALSNSDSGSYNIAIGRNSLANNLSSWNVAVGYNSLTGVTGSAGYQNTAIGNASGKSIDSGINNIFIGADAGNNALQKIDATNSMAIGSSTYTTASNQFIYGNSSVTQHIFTAGNIGIGITSSTARLQLPAGSATAGTAPLKFTSGTSLGTTEAGALEFDGTHLYFTVANAGTRYQLDQPRLDQFSAAGGNSTIDSLTNTLAWNWSTASTQNPFSITTAALSSGKAFSITSGGTTALTSGNALLVTGPTGAAALSGAAGGVVNLTAAGSYTSTNNAGLFNLNSGTATGPVEVITANAITTGTALYIPHTTSVIATGGSLVRISSSSIDTNITQGTLLDLSSSASLAGTQFLQTYTGLTTGIGQQTTTAALTSGKAFSITAGGTTALTSGNALLVTGPTGAAALSGVAGGVVNITAAGAYTSTNNAGLLNLNSSTAAGPVEVITANAITTGTALYIPHTTSVIATGGSLVRISSSSIDTNITQGTLLDLSSSASLAGTQFLQTYTGLTTGIGQQIVANGLSSGMLLDLESNGTAGLNNQKGLNIALTGTNGTALQTTYGAYISNTHAGTTSTNVGLYATATGGTTANWAAQFVIAATTTAVARFTNGTGYCDINPTTASLVCVSDLSLKKNIVTLSDDKEFILQNIPEVTTKSDYDKLMLLTPVKYNWKVEGDDASKHVGFIAQEMEQIFPDVVSTDSETGIKSIAYTNLIPYTIEVIQEMNLKLINLNDLAKPNDWRDSLVAWLANRTNSITRIFTGQVCLTEPGQEAVCLNRTELKSLKALINNSVTPQVSTSAPTPEPTPVVTPTPDVAPNPDVTPIPEVAPTPEITPVVSEVAPVPTASAVPTE